MMTWETVAHSNGHLMQYDFENRIYQVVGEATGQPVTSLETSSYGHPKAPAGKHWRWGVGTWERIQAGGSASKAAKASIPAQVSSAQPISTALPKHDRCVDCGVDPLARRDSHFHTSKADPSERVNPKILVVCCPCAQKREFVCSDPIDLGEDGEE